MSEQKFNENGIAVLVSKKPNCLIELTIDLDKQQCATCYQKAAKQVAKEISIPGFRKGHAPLNVIVEKFRPHLDKQYREELIQCAFTAGVRMSDIYPRSHEAIQKAKIEKIEDHFASISFIFETLPLVPEIDLSKVFIDHSPLEVQDAQIDAVIQSIRSSHGFYEDTDRTVADNVDAIKLTITSKDNNGEKIEHFKEHTFAFDENLPKWLSSAIIGMEVNQTKEVIPDSKDIPSPLEITLNKILNRKLPEVNDALAQKVGANSVEKMRERIQLNLLRKMEEARAEKQIEELRSTLLDLYSFEIPQGLVEAEQKARLARKEEQLKDANKSDEERTKALVAFEEGLAEKAEKDIRWFFILDTISKKDHIVLTKADREAIYAYETELHNRYFGAGKDPEKLKQKLKSAEFNASQRKIEDHILSKVLSNK